MSVTISKRARFSYTPLSAEDMRAIAETVALSVKSRIQNGQNVSDQPARLLKPGKNGRGGYPAQKVKRGDKPIRDWTFTGDTLRALSVTDASPGRAVIGFMDDKADRVAHYNNMREVQFGLSPKDQAVFEEAVSEKFKSNVGVEEK